jgi:hypothetical protein
MPIEWPKAPETCVGMLNGVSGAIPAGWYSGWALAVKTRLGRKVMVAAWKAIPSPTKRRLSIS